MAVKCKNGLNKLLLRTFQRQTFSTVWMHRFAEWNSDLSGLVYSAASPHHSQILFTVCSKQTVKRL